MKNINKNSLLVKDRFFGISFLASLLISSLILFTSLGEPLKNVFAEDFVPPVSENQLIKESNNQKLAEMGGKATSPKWFPSRR